MSLTPKTLVPLGSVTALLGATLWLNSTLMDMKHDIHDIKRSMPGYWTVSDMRAWEASMRASNTNLVIPSATDIYRNRIGSIQ